MPRALAFGLAFAAWPAPGAAAPVSGRVLAPLAGAVDGIAGPWPVPLVFLVPLFGGLLVLAAATFVLFRRLRDARAMAVERPEAAAHGRGTGFGALFDANPHPMWIYDLETLRFLSVNDAAVDRYGYSREEFLTLTIADIRPREDVPKLLQNVAAARGGLDRAGIWRHVAKDGSLIEVEITSHAIDHGGRPAKVVLALDLTERLRAERELRASEERLSLALRGTSDGLWDWEVDTGRDYLSPRWKEMLGFAPGELPDLRESFFERLHPDDAERVREALRAHLERGAEYDVELRLRTKAGAYRWFRSRGRATRDANGRAVRVAGTLTDVHERVAAESALRRSNRALRTLSACNEALVRATDEDSLLRQVCDSLVEAGGFKMAWVGFAGHDAPRPVRPVASAGDVRGYLDAIDIGWADDDRGRGPTGTAIRERRIVTARDIAGEPGYSPWRAAALERGFLSSIALPLVADGGACIGALNVYAGEADAFGDEEAGLLAELADDLAFGLRALRDRAARAESERALEAVARRLRHLLEASPTILYSLRRVDGELRPEAASDNVVRILGYPVETVLRRGWWLANIHPDDRERAVGMIEGSERTGRAAHEYRFARHDGTYIWVLDELQITRDEAGAVVEVVGSWTDITERHEAEAAMRESEERLRLALVAARQGLYDLDVRTGEAVVSPEYATMLGYAPESFHETNAAWIERLHPDDRAPVAATYRDYVAGRIPEYRVEFRQRTAAGEWLWILSLGEVVERDAEGNPVRMLGTHTDITDRKRAEREREDLQSQLLQAQKMELVGQLAGGVAHDFNNMLTVIMGQTELALLRSDPAAETHASLLEIRRAAERSSDLTRQLLAFARRQPAAPRVLDLNDALGGMLKLLRRLIGEDIELAWVPGRDLWPVRVDPAQIDQIVTNLCVNARDAIEGVGRIIIETSNRVVGPSFRSTPEGAQPGEYACIVVSDDGSGIAPDVLEHIFEPFYTTKGVGRGTGLGLAMVDGVVRQNGGFVDVASEPGRGATFRIHLPRHAGAGEAAGPAPSAPLSPRGRGEKLLLVEDDPAILRLGARMLEGLGYAVVTAGTVAEALAAGSREDEIHLLVTDLVMPGMNGRDLAARLTVSRPALRTLFMSGYTADVIAHRGVLQEGVIFLEKPFTMNALATRVREALDRR